MGVWAISLRFPEGGVIVDSRAYLEMASSLQRGGWPGLAQAGLHWTPGYPVFLLLSESLTGTTLVGVGFVQLFLTGCACLALWWVGARLGSQTVGLAAAVLYATSPSTALWSLTIMSETLFAFLLVTALAAWIAASTGSRPIWGLVAGLGLGAASLVRPIGLPLVPLWAGLGLVAVSRASGRSASYLRVAFLVVGSIALVAPWVLRNWNTTGRLTFADVPRDTFVRFNLAYVVAEAEGISRDEAASRLSATVDSWDDALDIVERNPGIFLRQQMNGIRRSLIGVESGVWARQLGYDIERQGSFEILPAILAASPVEALGRLRTLLDDRETVWLTSLMLLAVAHMGVLYILGGAGLVSVLRKPSLRRADWVLVALSAVFLLVVPGAAGQARFRIPAEPFLALLGGAGLNALISLVRTRRAVSPDPTGRGSLVEPGAGAPGG